MMKMMRASGASVIIALTDDPKVKWFSSNKKDDNDDVDEKFKKFASKVSELGIQSNVTGIFSEHEMGSCRMGLTTKDGPIKDTGETWECDNIFVADASCFPTSLGVNPMITVCAMAHMVSRSVMDRLEVKAAEAE
jgi:long-chain-alcohol oxidase